MQFTWSTIFLKADRRPAIFSCDTRYRAGIGSLLYIINIFFFLVCMRINVLFLNKIFSPLHVFSFPGVMGYNIIEMNYYAT